MATLIAMAQPAATAVLVPNMGCTLVKFDDATTAIATVVCQHRGQIDVTTSARTSAVTLE